MTDHIEDRLLKLAEKGIAEGSYSEDGALYTLAVTGKRGPAIIAAICRVVAAAREDLLECHVCLCDEAWTGRGLHAPECKSDEVDDLRAALAALDAMEEKAE